MAQNGDTVEDVVTGARGLVVGRADYLFKSSEVMVQPFGRDQNDTPLEPYWLSEARVAAVSDKPKSRQGGHNEEEAGAA